ncbi:MAG: Smr/MutS family protein [Aquabacterium sp.]
MPRPRKPPSGDNGLSALQQIKQQLQAQAEAAALQQRRLAEQERQRQAQVAQALAEAEVFAREVGPVRRLPDHGRARLHRDPPPPEARMRERDEADVMRQALSDEVDAESLLLTDDGLSFRRPGLPPDVAVRLRRGQWALQDQIDLHGHTRDEAREALALFLRRARQRGLRCVRVVHGKGHGSPGREPVLKGRVQRWLAQWSDVVAFAQASGPQGGAGALIVLLERS